MSEEKKIYSFEITIKENTSWGLIHKTFSNDKTNVNRVDVIVEVVEYLSKYCHEDYVKAVKILRKKRNQ
jgi:hypothetical protein